MALSLVLFSQNVIPAIIFPIRHDSRHSFLARFDNLPRLSCRARFYTYFTLILPPDRSFFFFFFLITSAIVQFLYPFQTLVTKYFIDFRYSRSQNRFTEVSRKVPATRFRVSVIVARTTTPRKDADDEDARDSERNSRALSVVRDARDMPKVLPR